MRRRDEKKDIKSLNLPASLRAQIADKIIRTVAPATIALMLINLIGFFAWGNYQYNRLPSIIILLLFMPLAWILALRGRAIAGALVLLIGLNIGVIAGMIFSGGIFAISYIGVSTVITICSVVYGLKIGLAYTVIMIATGGLFVWINMVGLIMTASPPSQTYYFLCTSIIFGCQLFFVSVPIKLLFKALFDAQKTAGELDGILKRAPNIIFKTNITGEIQFVNQAVLRYGYRVDQLIGKNIKQFLHPEDKRDAVKLFAEDPGEAASGRFRIVLPQPQQRGLDKAKKKLLNTFIVKIEAIQSDHENSGEVHTGFQGIARDITKEKAYEAQLKHFEAVIEQAEEEEVVIYDAEGFILYTNPSFNKKSGWSKEDLLYKSITQVMEESDDKAFYHEIRSAISHKTGWKGEVQSRQNNGEIILYDVNITPIVDTDGRISAFSVVRRDISQKVKAAQHLQQVHKMEAIGTLAGGIAHDFNNILGAVMGYAELVKDDLTKDSVAYGRQQQVVKASVRAKKLVEQILLFSRQSDQLIKPLQPHLIIKEALKLLRSSIPSTIEIRQNIPGDLGCIVADSTQIHQIVMNLCTNSYHAMRENGGVLSITLSKREILEDDVTFVKMGFAPGAYMVLEVSDTGHGMDKKTMDKVFDPYFTTKPKGEGTGLGLSVIHGIVKNYCGQIQIDSEPGNGTTVRVYFPVAETSETGFTAQPDQGLQTGYETILVIDDDPSILEMMALSLESLGYSTICFSDSLAALAAFENDAKKIDLIITDMTMPKMTGIELARQVFDRKPGMPVILCTGFSELISREKAEALGIKGFLLKPVLRKDLAGIIRSVLDQPA